MILGRRNFYIPVISFNIKTNFRGLEGQAFVTQDGKRHSIEEAYQRTGFILNEKGAVIESEAYSTVDSVGIAPEPPHPKRMIFNKPFYVLMKRIDQQNPYFVMKVENAELLTRY